MKRFSLVGVMAVAILGMAVWSFAANPESVAQAPAQIAAAGQKVVETVEKITLFEPLVSSKYAIYEKIALVTNVVIALAGLAYALMLVKQVMKAPTRARKKMQEIAQAVREGANAYLYRQFRVVGVLIVLITVLLYFAAKASRALPEIVAGAGPSPSSSARSSRPRSASSACGWPRSATSAWPPPRKTSFGQALQLGYRTGTITGMLTDGLGLLGGSIIFLIYGEHAYEALLGLRLRRHAAGLVHACRRRHLHQGGRRRRRPGRQGRSRHPRGRSPQRRHHRRQRRRQRRRLCRYGRRHLRELRSDHRGGHDPGHRQLRPQGRDLPLAGPRHRRHRQHHQHLQRAGRRQGLASPRP